MTYHCPLPIGPSTQAAIGPDRVVFDTLATFPVDTVKQLTVSAVIIDDDVAFEDDEVVYVHLTIDSPPFNVSLGAFPTTVVNIVDSDCKLATVK